VPDAFGPKEIWTITSTHLTHTAPFANGTQDRYWYWKTTTARTTQFVPGATQHLSSQQMNTTDTIAKSISGVTFAPVSSNHRNPRTNIMKNFIHGAVYARHGTNRMKRT